VTHVMLPHVARTALLAGGSGLAAFVFAAGVHAAPPQDLATCGAAFSAAPDLAKNGKLLAARAQLSLCAADPCPGSMRPLCAEDLRHIDERIPTVVFVVKGPHGEDLLDVRVSENGAALAARVDGRTVSLDPGPHTFRFEGSHGDAVDLPVVLHEGEKARAIAVTLGAPPASLGPAAQTPGPSPAPAATNGRPIPWAVYLAGAVTVAAGASFAYFGASGLSERSSLGGCKGTCSSSLVNQVTTHFTIADVSWVTGLVALAVTGVLYFTRPTVVTATSNASTLFLTTSF
jgi:hypothetical protein